VGLPIVNIAWIFSGFASIPLADTRPFCRVELELVPIKVVEGFF
jgi:hypothetical protein